MVGNETIKNLLLLKFREEDLNKLNDIYYLLNDYFTNKGKKALYRKSKKVIFIIYLQKNNVKTKNYMSFLSDCPQIMISNLYNEHKNFPEILISSTKAFTIIGKCKLIIPSFPPIKFSHSSLLSK